jgi:hypothetical protein
MANPETAVAVIEQPADAGVVEWNLDAFPIESYNRLLPTQTLQLPTDLLRPVVQVVQLNPDTKAGDVYASSDMPNGHAAPTRVGLRKLATAAGISFIDERRVDDGRDPDVIEVTTVAEMLLPTGQRIRAVGTKRVDLNAQTWASPQHRARYKSFFQEQVASRAQNRAIRALLSLRGSYPQGVYERPFAVVSFAPNMAHPEVRARVLDVMAGASAQLYGGQPAAQLEPGKTVNVTPAPEEDPAPEQPTQLPGEHLARAEATDEPDWITGAKADEPAAPTEPRLVTLLRESAEGAGQKGPINAAQKKRLGPLFAPLSGTGEFGTVIAAAFGQEFITAPTAAQAHALMTIADSYDGGDEAFLEAWRGAAATIREAAG